MTSVFIWDSANLPELVLETVMLMRLLTSAWQPPCLSLPHHQQEMEVRLLRTFWGSPAGQRIHCLQNAAPMQLP